MKKLMIGFVGALAMVASAEVTSSNIVGCQGNNVAFNARAMRTAATFLKIGTNPTDIKLSDFQQVEGDPGDLTFCFYDDNVTRIAQYGYIAEEAAADEDVESGWYQLTVDGDLDFESGVKDAALPYGQGCVINSANSSAKYISAGEVDSIKREFSVPFNARKMMGNVLPRMVRLSELKQTVGDPGDLTFCTYDDNVTRTAQYGYIDAEAASDEGVEAGWYQLTSDGDLDFESGLKDLEIPAGQGFVVNSANSSAVLQFPTAM